MHSLKTLQELTLKWSTDRGIITNGKAITQVCKLTEEVCETLTAAVDDNDKEVKDGIGDSLVVCCNLSRLIGYEYDFISTIAFDISTNPFIECIRALGKLNKMVNAGKYEEAQPYFNELVSALFGMAYEIESTPTECWNLAYEEIKDRKGYLTVHGNFIKEADMQPSKQLTMEFDND